MSVLREVKYLEDADIEGVPEEAAKIFAAKESFRQYVANVDLAQQWYNKVSQSITNICFNLFQYSKPCFLFHFF